MIRTILTVLLLSLLIDPTAAQPQRETVFQASTIDALLGGVYDGVLSFEEALKYGDLGLGTVDRLDGELVILDGTCYQIQSDGTVQCLSPEMTTPWVMVTSFEARGSRSLTDLTLLELKATLDEEVLEHRYLYALRLDGKFKNLKLRSVPAQTKPYRPLAEVVKEQSVFEYTELEGTVVAFRTPQFLSGVSVPGYHFHFLSKDRKRGGHVLDLSVDTAELQWDRCEEFVLRIPELQEFHQVDLERDRSKELDMVEK